MTSTHPQDDTTDSAERRAETTPYRDERSDYGDDRSDYRTGYGDDRPDYRTGYGDDRPDYRDETMTRSEPTRYQTTRGDIRTRKVRETKPAFLTTEFWFAAGGIAALIVIYLVADNPDLDLFRTALLATLIGVAYIVSRGLAKAGSRTTRQPEDPRFTVGHDIR